MLRISMRRAAAGVGAAAGAVVLLAACGDDDGGSSDSADTFCEEMVDVQADLGSLSTGDPAGIESVVDRLREVDPPAEVAEAYEAVVDAYATLADGDGLTDPAAQETVVAAQEHATELTEYVADNCGAPGAGEGT
jgi:hypothetical protein